MQSPNRPASLCIDFNAVVGHGVGLSGCGSTRIRWRRGPGFLDAGVHPSASTDHPRLISDVPAVSGPSPRSRHRYACSHGLSASPGSASGKQPPHPASQRRAETTPAPRCSYHDAATSQPPPPGSGSLTLPLPYSTPALVDRAGS